jgi:multimeric flavodoxin WrbA
MITILSDGTTKELGQDLYETIVKTRPDARLFCLENMRIEPCYACRGCEQKTCGRCVVRDDADEILPCVVRSETIMVLTPVVFGGYSFPIKRLVDKFSLIVDRHYCVRNGELTKGKPKKVGYYVIGVHEGIDDEDTQIFRQLVRENIRIASWKGRPIVLPHDEGDYRQLIREAAGI